MSQRRVGRTFSCIQELAYNLRGSHFLEVLFRIVGLENIELSRKTFLFGLFSPEEILFFGKKRKKKKKKG